MVGMSAVTPTIELVKSWYALSGWIVFITAGILLLSGIVASFRFYPLLKFVWHAFIAPIGHADQQTRLDKFYRGQAEIYDETRKGLLRGRKTMLNLSASHLRQMRAASPSGRLVWVDIGGGTGYNIEAMNEYMPLQEFDAIYLVDLCEPLCAIARARFLRRGWKNVHVICTDAGSFVLPEPGWSPEGGQKGSVSFVTLSYSLSMIPNFYPVVDRINHILEPSNGLLGVVDFYTAGRSTHVSLHERAIGGAERECGWLSRWFWQIWFDFDNVYLGSQRREYLEYKFGTIKSYNGRNRFVLPFIIRIPYYIWLGRPRTCDVSRFLHAFEVESGNTIGNTTPKSIEARSRSPSVAGVYAGSVPALDIGDAALPLVDPALKLNDAVVIDVTPPLSSFHYQIKKPWRLPYYEQPVHNEFRTFVYSFTWEDPVEDMKHLNIGPNDIMFVITSAGDNALHCAIQAKPKRIHCVDINPCQGHLFELKLAAIQTLSYADFFALFGAGYHPRFRQLLDSQLSPWLSSIAYQFWRINAYMFEGTRKRVSARNASKEITLQNASIQPITAHEPSFYLRGYSGLALRFARFLFTITGASEHIKSICSANSISEQVDIYNAHIRPILLNPIVALLLRTPMFCWNALGVPMNQLDMLLREGTMWEYVRDSFDGVPRAGLLGGGAYHYLLTLLGRYTTSSCPLYLTRDGYDSLRADKGTAMDTFRLHTDSIINALRGLPSSSLTRAIIMDHLDWFAREGTDARAEIVQLYRTLTPEGFVLLRSAARKPWYMELFVEAGFQIEALAVRTPNSGKPIDRVNMYASFWKAQKI